MIPKIVIKVEHNWSLLLCRSLAAASSSSFLRRLASASSASRCCLLLSSSSSLLLFSTSIALFILSSFCNTPASIRYSTSSSLLLRVARSIYRNASCSCTVVSLGVSILHCSQLISPITSTYFTFNKPFVSMRNELRLFISVHYDNWAIILRTAKEFTLLCSPSSTLRSMFKEVNDSSSVYQPTPLLVTLKHSVITAIEALSTHLQFSQLRQV